LAKIVETMNKKALSPVIATVLLISLVLVLAMIIFLWAKAFVPEAIQKNGASIDTLCKDVIFTADYSGGTITVQNNGNLPLYNIKVFARGGGSSKEINVTGMPVMVQGSGTFELSPDADISSSSELLVAPMLLGENTAKEQRAFVCSNDFAQTISLQA
jgi:flagellin-like protein